MRIQVTVGAVSLSDGLGSLASFSRLACMAGEISQYAVRQYSGLELSSVIKKIIQSSTLRRQLSSSLHCSVYWE